MSATPYFAFPIFQYGGRLTLGVPFDTKPHPTEDAEIMVCPMCGAELVEDSLIPGYGLAFGGFGTYWYCDTPDCDWFYKEMSGD